MKVIIALIAIFVFCYSKAEEKVATWVKPDTTMISCDDYYTLVIDQGVLTNNVWNKHAAGEEDWSQCLEKRQLNGQTQYGWSWSWPSGRRVIYSQPQIKVGSSPWAPEPRFDNNFPMRISDLKTLDISHKLDIDTNGNHNTAITMWLVLEPYRGSRPNPATIAAEVMIWTYATKGHLDPAGKKRDEITTGKATWEVWHQKNWDDKSGQHENKWINISFRTTSPTMSADVNSLALLQYAARHGLIEDNWYIADIELGNEVMDGSGIAWVEKFDVHYERISH